MYMSRSNYLICLNNFIKIARKNNSNYDFAVRKLNILIRGRHMMYKYYKFNKTKSPKNGKNPGYYEP